ncbi:hypothetical protein CW304_12300 [Bacillus sp. UFRGS-B20]|nr:hypothetical protein CW304_12300 [Bacillus sp. UFRGS-B20]
MFDFHSVHQFNFPTPNTLVGLCSSYRYAGNTFVSFASLSISCTSFGNVYDMLKVTFFYPCNGVISF